MSQGRWAASRSWKWQGNGLSLRDSRKKNSHADILFLVQKDLFWTSQLQNCEMIHLCCLSHYICGNLLQQQKEANRVSSFKLQSRHRTGVSYVHTVQVENTEELYLPVIIMGDTWRE